MLGKLDDYLRFHQTALSLRAERQQLLASNIANADTPNYKARDIDFKQVLQQAVQGGQAGQGNAASPASAVGLVKTASGHLPGKLPAGALAQGTIQAQYRTVQQGSVDGNTVDMDTERTNFADNAIRYQASVQLINGQIRTMMSAIQGQ
jgi:flagellar basal-body rod protein FlgB